MNLYVVRHAWAGHSGDPRYPDDSLRPLSQEGRKRFRKLVEKLVARGFDPAHVATSPLMRCVETAEIIADLAPRSHEVTRVDALAPGGRHEDVLAAIGDSSADVALVGHAPDVEFLTAALIGDGDAQLRFAKGAVAKLEFDGAAALGRGALCWLATADIMLKAK